jgi:hypothetical protein
MAVVLIGTSRGSCTCANPGASSRMKSTRAQEVSASSLHFRQLRRRHCVQQEHTHAFIHLVCESYPNANKLVLVQQLMLH